MASIAEAQLRPLLLRLGVLPHAEQVNDRQLMEQFVAFRQEAAFRALVERHGPMVMGVCRRVLHNLHDAEDAFQATFLVLARKANSVSPPDLVANWLHGVAWRTAQKARVSRKRSNNILQRLFERVTAMPVQTSATPEAWRDVQPILDQELQRLPAKYRIAIILCDLERQSRKDAARQLGWLEGTLSGRLARARKLLAKRLTSRGITLSVAALVGALTQNSLSAAMPSTLSTNVVKAGLLAAGGSAIPTGIVSTAAIALSEKVMNAMLLAKQAMAVLLLAAAGLVATATHLVAQRGDPQARPAVNQVADAELHMIGVYQAKGHIVDPGPVDVEVRATEKPVVLVLTAYSPVEWRVKLAAGARVNKVIVSGYNAQEVTGLPANVPVVNRSYYPNDGSRSKNGWFYAYQWNTPHYREVVRRVNDITGLPVTTFQSVHDGEAFVIDGSRGRQFAQKGIKQRPMLKEPKPEELQALAAGADLHVVGISDPSRKDPGQPVKVDVRSPNRPVVLAVSSSMEAVWMVKAAEGTRIKAVLVGGSSPQEIDGLPADVPVYQFFPDSETMFEGRTSRNPTESFSAHRFNTFEYRRMVERLNDMTGLLVASFQGASDGQSFVVDGKNGQEFTQKERWTKPTAPKPIKTEELRSLSTGAELHLVSVYWTGPGNNGTPIDVEVKPSGKPIVLALASYFSVLWNVKIADSAQVKAVIVGGYFEQEHQGIPKNIPVVYQQYYPTLNTDFFFAYETNSEEYKNELNKLNDMTGLLIATAQVENVGSSFVIDGKRGRELQQKERLPQKAAPAGQKKAESDEDPLAEVADIPSQELKAGDDADKRYFLIGPKKDTKPPSDGFGLVVIMPGGDGSADFNPFIRRICKHALGERFVAAQPVAPKWTPEQKIVWPTKTNPAEKMKFTTEDFVEAVVTDVAKRMPIDRSRIFTLSWSSSGPAAYSISLQEKKSVTGSLVAMSVFHPQFLPPPSVAKDHPYFLYHSPQDRICKYSFAEEAKKTLEENGAKVKLETYQGGHGWRGNLYADIRKGIEWLEENRTKPAKP